MLPHVFHFEDVFIADKRGGGELFVGRFGDVGWDGPVVALLFWDNLQLAWELYPNKKDVPFQAELPLKLRWFFTSVCGF